MIVHTYNELVFVFTLRRVGDNSSQCVLSKCFNLPKKKYHNLNEVCRQWRGLQELCRQKAIKSAYSYALYFCGWNHRWCELLNDAAKPKTHNHRKTYKDILTYGVHSYACNHSSPPPISLPLRVAVQKSKRASCVSYTNSIHDTTTHIQCAKFLFMYHRVMKYVWACMGRK